MTERVSHALHVMFSMHVSPFYPHLNAVNYQIDLQTF